MTRLINVMTITMVTLLTGCGFEVVDTGHRGVQTRFGEVVSDSLPEGLHFYNPFTSDIQELDVTIQKASGKLSTYTKDIQQASINIAVTYSLKKDQVHLIYKEYRHDIAERELDQAVNGAVKAVVGTWDAVDLISNREKAREQIELMLRDALAKKFLLVKKFELVDIEYNESFEGAVERKVTAIRRAIEAKNKTVQIQEEAKQRLIKAEAEAKSMAIRAQALTQNKSLVEYEAAQRWDGKMPQYMLGGGALPFINLGPK